MNHKYQPIGTGECWQCGKSFYKHHLSGDSIYSNAVIGLDLRNKLGSDKREAVQVGRATKFKEDVK